jgi:hypothetical protein
MRSRGTLLGCNIYGAASEWLYGPRLSAPNAGKMNSIPLLVLSTVMSVGTSGAVLCAASSTATKGFCIAWVQPGGGVRLSLEYHRIHVIHT